MSEYEKPLPEVNDLNRPHWEAAKEHKFVIQRCRGCGHMWFPPMTICSTCLSQDIEWFQPKGTGKVHSEAICVTDIGLPLLSTMVVPAAGEAGVLVDRAIALGHQRARVRGAGPGGRGRRRPRAVRYRPRVPTPILQSTCGSDASS